MKNIPEKIQIMKDKYVLLMDMSDEEIRRIPDASHRYYESVTHDSESLKIARDPVMQKLEGLYLDSKLEDLSNLDLSEKQINYFSKAQALKYLIEEKMKNRKMRKKEYTYLLTSSKRKIKKALKNNEFDLNQEAIENVKKLFYY